jgi:hypothetical protein
MVPGDFLLTRNTDAPALWLRRAKPGSANAVKGTRSTSVPGRVPKLSRALAPPGKARLRQRDDGNPDLKPPRPAQRGEVAERSEAGAATFHA